MFDYFPSNRSTGALVVSAPARLPAVLAALLVSVTSPAHALLYGHVQGVVHDPQHRPVAGSLVTLHAAHSAEEQTATTGADGSFRFPSVTLGEYTLNIAAAGFASQTRTLIVQGDGTEILHVELALGSVVSDTQVSEPLNENTATTTTLVSRAEIASTPGAELSNSLQMITDYVPGAYMTHDMLHMRGGHQVSWLLNGVMVPNTNIATNLGPQIDPKDIDYLDVGRGGYAASAGDRTYGVMNVVPRSGFESNRQAELVVTAGSFLETNDQLNFGSHTERLAYYGSVNGNRSDYGLAAPTPVVVHDAENGFGGLLSLIDNRGPHDQFRFVSQLRRDFYQIPYDPDASSLENQVYDSNGLRDGQKEADGLATLTWAHTFGPRAMLTLSPFYHYNQADEVGNPDDRPVASTAIRQSNYGGAQSTFSATLGDHSMEAGVYGFGQRDHQLFRALFNDGSAANFTDRESATGGLEELWFGDTYRVTPWLTVGASLRQSHFSEAGGPGTGSLTEDVVYPRTSVAVEVPKLHWVFRAFYGRYYQPPPLLTLSGPLLAYAQSASLSYGPLHGERDEEHQFGVQIPWRGWVLDADTFKTRANNFLDHNNIGESNLFFPVTVDGALINAWELTLRTPRLFRRAQGHLAYSNQVAQGRGAITGGLLCSPGANCDTSPDYGPLDHDQRNTLSVGGDTVLPGKVSVTANVSYGSGFVNGDPNQQYPGDYLPAHSSVDLSLGRSFGENLSASITTLNVTNHRTLLDNSLTFGGFHYNDPRQIYAELRYRFRY